MLRSGQMILAEALIRRHLGRGIHVHCTAITWSIHPLYNYVLTWLRKKLVKQVVNIINPFQPRGFPLNWWVKLFGVRQSTIIIKGLFFASLGSISGSSANDSQLEFFKLFSPRPAKTVPFVILLCLMADYFTCEGRTFGRERVYADLAQMSCMYTVVHYRL